MRVLIAEDDLVSQKLLATTLHLWGYDVTVTGDGKAAWEELQKDDGPRLAILDWMMPEMDGAEVCRRARASQHCRSSYLILLTARQSSADRVTGLKSGADDYLTKPFEREELRARIEVGERVLGLQRELSQRIEELEAHQAHIKQLQGILPMCCYCKNIRQDEHSWRRIEDYVSAHADVNFSHGICPECWETVVNAQMEEMWGEKLPYED